MLEVLRRHLVAGSLRPGVDPNPRSKMYGRFNDSSLLCLLFAEYTPPVIVGRHLIGNASVLRSNLEVLHVTRIDD